MTWTRPTKRYGTPEYRAWLARRYPDHLQTEQQTAYALIDILTAEGSIAYEYPTCSEQDDQFTKIQIMVQREDRKGNTHCQQIYIKGKDITYASGTRTTQNIEVAAAYCMGYFSGYEWGLFAPRNYEQSLPEMLGLIDTERG